MPPLLINHGEKAVVALVALLALWLVIAAFDNPETVPPRSTAQVEQDFARINAAINNPGRPNLREPPDVAGRIRTRLSLAEDLPGQAVYAFIHEVWSLGRTTDLEFPPFLYGYELRRPELSVEDQIGSLRLALRLPAAQRPRDHQRLRDGVASLNIQRSINPRESYTNTAEVLGVQVQRRTPGGDWQGLPHVQNDLGFIPLAQADQALQLRDVSEWQTYEFRARLLAAATGPTEEGRPSLGNEVLVFAGESPLPADPNKWKEQDELAYQGVPLSIPTAERLQAAAQQTLQRLLTDRTLDQREQVYLGPWSKVAAEQVSSTTRFVLSRVSPPVVEGAQPRVLFELTRKHEDQWIPLQRMEVELGDRLGDERWEFTNPEDGLNEYIDLSTPFKLVEVDLEAERVTHYEIRNSSDASGGRELTITPRINQAARTATLENVHTGQRLTLVQLSRVVVRQPTDIMKNYPHREPGVINELELFENDPMNFRQPKLTLPDPIWHEPDDPTLRNLFPNEAPPIETRYLELPDGRFLVIDALNPRIIRVFVRPDGTFAQGRDQGDDQDEEAESQDGNEE